MTASDGTNTTTQAITVNVTNINDNSPVFTSSATFSAAENQTSIGIVTATDADSGDSITFTVSGSELVMTSAGVLSFASAPDYETKASYTATVTASDGTNTTTQSITVTVTDVNESSVTAVGDINSTDEDNSVTFDPLANDTIVTGGYAVSLTADTPGNGAVTVNSGNTLTYTPSSNFFGTDTFNYTITVNSVSGTGSVTITVNSVNDLPIISGLSSTLTPNENQTNVVTVNASDIETSSLTYSISGTDSSLFSISSSGVLSFKSAPDYEAPGDANADNSYSLTVSVGDGTATTSQSITVEVQNVADQVSGVAVDGYVAGATVFQDLDNDGVLDSGEPNTSTNALGSFTLTLSSVNKSAPVRIINGYDLATNEIHPSVMDISVTETGSYIITPISTLVGRLKIEDTTLSGTVPQSMIAAAMGISLADSPNDSILGFDPIAYFNGSDTTLATEARPVFAASQLLMAQGGGNYGVNKYVTDQVLSALSSTLTTKSGSSISMSSSADITAIKQDAYDAIFNGIVDTTLADNPPINNVQFKNNKAVMTDYLNGSSSSQVQHSLYGAHDGTTTLVADLVGAKLDYENLKQIVDNDGTGRPMDLSFELSSLPIGSGSTSVNLRLFHGSDTVQGSDEDYLQVAFSVNWESDGNDLNITLPASNNVVNTFFDRSGTTISRTTANSRKDLITTSKTGPNTPSSFTVKLASLFNAFPTEVSGLSSFLDGAATFTYQVEFGSFTLYDHLENPFTKIQGTFGVNSTPDIAIFADDIYVHENATSKEITFRLSQASSSNVTVDYAISGSSTASSSDYTLSAGTATIPAGSTSTTLAIAVTNDTAVESQEELRLSLSNPQNAVLGRTTVSAYITDGEKILDNSAQKTILVNNIFKDSKMSITEYVKNKLDNTSVTISGTSYTYSQVLVNESVTSDVYAYVDGIVDDYEVMAEAIISAIMTKSNAYVDSQLSGFSTYSGFAQALTQLNSGLKGLNVSQIAGTNINSNGTYPFGQSISTLQTTVESKIDTLVTLAADTVADILGTDTNANFPNANVIMGTDGDDTISGTSGSDLIASFNGTDTVNAGAGNDKILGGSGVDTINGGDNDDHIYGYAGADILAGDAGDDKILGGLDNDTIRGGAGDDDLRGEAGDDTIYTGAGTDTVTGGLGDDTIIIDGL
uniref:Ig-like domain-containing protein n=1 Tax=Flavobacterium sp. TaxID=239 RepID=UPI0040486CD1